MRAWAPWTALVLGLAFTAAVTLQISREIHAKDQARFQNQASQVAENVESRINTYVALLRAGAGLFDVSTQLSGQNFRDFIQRLSVDTRYPGVQGIGYALRVSADQKTEIEAQMRSEIGPTFHIWPDQGQAEYFAIVYLEPQDERNRAAIGYDMYSNPIRREAMERARDAAAPASTQKVTLVQEIDKAKQAGFLIYVPIYAGGDVPPSIEQRRALLRGFVYSPFRAGDLLRNVFNPSRTPLVDFEVFDGEAPDQRTTLYESFSASSPPRQQATFATSKTIDVAGRKWLLQFYSSPALDFTSDNRKVPMVALVGLLISFLLFGITLAQARARSMADERHQVAEDEIKKRREVDEQLRARNDQLQQSITELERAHQELQFQNDELASTRQAIERERRRYRDLFDFAPDGQIVLDMKGIVREANKAAASMLNVQASQLQGEPLMSFVCESSIAVVRDVIETARRAGRVEDQAIEFRPVNNPPFEGAITLALLHDRSGAEIGYQCLFRDITERLHAQQRIQANARRQETLAHIGRLAMTERDVQLFMSEMAELTTRALDVEFCKVLRLAPSGEYLALEAGFGWSAGLIGRAIVPADHDTQPGFTLLNHGPVIVEDLRSETRFTGSKLLLDHGVRSGISVIIMGEGNRAYGVLGAHSARVRRFAQDDVNFLQTVAHILSAAIERKRGEESLRRSEEQFRASFELAAVGEAQVEPHTGRLRRVNHKLCEITGYDAEELLCMTFVQLTSADHRGSDWENWQSLIRGEVPELRLESVYRRKNGEPAWVLINATAVRNERGKPERCILVVQDVTEIKQTQMELAEHRSRLEDLVAMRTQELERSHQQLRLSERMAALGTLSAGLGHDMGNLLLPVRLRLDAIEAKGVSPDIQDDLQAIRKCAEYLQRLVNGLRLFALDPEDTEASSQRTEINEWWSDVQPFLHNALPRSVELSSDFADDLPPLKIAKHLLTQMVFNLVQNAGDSLRQREKGEVRIRAAVDRNADYIQLIVSDNGPGMTNEVRQRCMEPFFTTKTRGLSTGLGLALVHGIVQKIGGWVDLDTAVGQGTTFTLHIPVYASTKAFADEGRSDPLLAVLSLRNARTRAYIASVLQSLSFDVEIDATLNGTPASLWIIDAGPESIEQARRFVEQHDDRRVVMLGGEAETIESDAVTVLEENPKPAVIRKALQKAAIELGARRVGMSGQT